MDVLFSRKRVGRASIGTCIVAREVAGDFWWALFPVRADPGIDGFFKPARRLAEPEVRAGKFSSVHPDPDQPDVLARGCCYLCVAQQRDLGIVFRHVRSLRAGVERVCGELARSVHNHRIRVVICIHPGGEI